MCCVDRLAEPHEGNRGLGRRYSFLRRRNDYLIGVGAELVRVLNIGRRRRFIEWRIRRISIGLGGAQVGFEVAIRKTPPMIGAQRAIEPGQPKSRCLQNVGHESGPLVRHLACNQGLRL